MILWIGLIVVATAFYLHLFPDTDHHSEDLLPQWTLARLAVTGHRAESYSYVEQKKLFEAEIPPLKAGILESPHIRDIGVSPYPPTMVLLFAPMGFFSYERAAQIVFVFTLSLSLIAAGAIAASTRWRLSGFAATALVLVYPGFAYNLLLGQNAARDAIAPITRLVRDGARQGSDWPALPGGSWHLSRTGGWRSSGCRFSCGAGASSVR